MRAVLKGEQVADVPCDGCVGCCVSSYAIPLRPDGQGGARRGAGSLPAACPSDGRPGAHGASRGRHLPDARRRAAAPSTPTVRRPAATTTAASTRPRGLLPDGKRPVIRDRVLEWRFDIANRGGACPGAMRCGGPPASSASTPPCFRPPVRARLGRGRSRAGGEDLAAVRPWHQPP